MSIITIDNKKVEFEVGLTVLQVCELAGVEIYGASPSSVYVSCYIRLPYSIGNDGTKVYKPEAMPTIKKGTRFRSNSNVVFYSDIIHSFRSYTNSKDSAASKPL